MQHGRAGLDLLAPPDVDNPILPMRVFLRWYAAYDGCGIFAMVSNSSVFAASEA